MSFTRFNDDPCRINKQLQESTDPGRYMLNVPGNGDKPCFMEDPYIRLQKWGANLHTNTINLESELMGLSINKNNRNNNRDCIDKNQHNLDNVNNKAINYPNCNPITEQSRVTNPVWLYRDLEQNNLNTRILERDNFTAYNKFVN